MNMISRPIKNAGYLLAMGPQILLVVGTHIGFPWLSIVFFFAVLPLVRKFIGNDLSPPNKKPSPLLTMYLRAIPRLYCAIWAIVLPWAIWILATKPMSIPQYIGFTLSLWIVCALNTAIAHELVHIRSSVGRKLGEVMDASVGYFHFAEEHLSHHARNGHYYEADAAMPGTTIYAFAFHRYCRSLRVAWEYEAARLKRFGGSWFANRLIRKAVIPIAIAGAFYVFAGPLGLVVYLFQFAGAAFSVQAITYLQHWGLSEKETPTLADYGFSWEDGCWMQACVTLNHAFHGQHHLNASRPFYQLSLIQGGLTLPASYPVMFVVALFPRFFTNIMKSRLALWIENDEMREMLKHSTDCIGARRIAQAMRKGQTSQESRSSLEGVSH